MTVHINQYFALMDQNHGGEKEWGNYVCNYVTCIYIPGNIIVFMADWIISCHLSLAKDGDWVKLHYQILGPGYMKFSYIQG